MIKERKLFFVWQQDKEKRYLEDKAREGLLLRRVGFGWYEFNQTEPKELIYDFDFQIVSNKNEKEYLSFFEDWEYVTRFGGWYYFRKVASNESSLYSNNETKRKMYNQLIGFLLLVAFPLYYQVIFLFPKLKEQGEFSPFYQVFQTIIYVFLLLHFYALIKIVIYRNKYTDKTSE